MLRTVMQPTYNKTTNARLIPSSCLETHAFASQNINFLKVKVVPPLKLMKWRRSFSCLGGQSFATATVEIGETGASNTFASASNIIIL